MAGDSLGALFKDKKVQVGAAVVGGVGLLVLVMRRGGSGGASGGAGQTVIQPAAGLDSSASDLYNALQDLGQGWQRDLNGFTSQLSNVNDKLSKLPTSGTGSQPTPTPTHPTTSPRATVSVQQGWHVDQYLKDSGFSWGQLAAANPDLSKYTTYANNNGFWDLLTPSQRQQGGAPVLVFGGNRTLNAPG